MPPGIKVDTKTLEGLEASLLAMMNDPELYRSAVIKAKDRMRFASRNPKVAPEKQAVKEEMVRWMLVWLDDAAMFPAWVGLRKKQLEARRTAC